MTEYKSPTAMVWLLGRIYCTGTPEDYDAVHKLQDEISVVPLSSYGKPYTPPPGNVDPSIDMKTAVREQVNALSVEEYFTLLAKLMKDNPPAAADKPMVKKMAKIGIVPGQPFDSEQARPAGQGRLLHGARRSPRTRSCAGSRKASSSATASSSNGWIFTTKTGIYGANYIQRAPDHRHRPRAPTARRMPSIPPRKGLPSCKTTPARRNT